MAVDPGTGRAFVRSDGDLRVLDTRTYQDDVAALPGPWGDPVALDGSIYAVRDGAIRRISPVTLEETGSWTAPSIYSSTRLSAGDGGLLWETQERTAPGEPPGYPTTVHRLDPVTGAVTASSTSYPWLTGLTAVDDGAVIWSQFSGLAAGLDGAEPGPFVDLGIDNLFDIALDDEATIATAVDYGKEQAVDFSLPGFIPTGDTYDFDGVALQTATTSANGGAVAIVTIPDPYTLVPKLQVYRRGQSTPVVEVSIPGPSGIDLAFSPDGTQLFALTPDQSSNFIPGRLVVAELTSDVVATAYPPVVGSRGGAKVVVKASLGTGSTVRVGGDPVDVTVARGTVQTLGSTIDEIGFAVPATAPGTEPVEVTNALGHAVSGGSVRVVDLGPFVNAPWFVHKQFSDVTGERPTAQQIDAGIQSLAAGATAGEVIASLEAGRGQATTSAALIRLYRAVFLRPPDTGGLTYWLGRMEGGTRLVQVAATFAGSREFKNRYGSLSDPAFVDRIYQNILGRPADPSGRAYWIRKLGAGTSRGVLVAQFAQSGEYVTKSSGDVQKIELRLAMLDKTPTEAQLAPLRSMDLADVAWTFLNDPSYKTSG